ncbi:MAG: HAMP domain-containing histidine kinase [Chitinophagales bacterium]|nr:HAMP domain-containing histidine kinase [Chitinophagales bacterium]
MKLLTKINRNFLFTSVILFVLCSYLFYFLLRYVIYCQVDENVTDAKTRIIEFVQQNGELPVAQSFAGNRLEVRKVKPGEKVTEQLKDTLIYDIEEQENVPYRQLSFLLPFKDEPYCISVSQSQFEADDLITSILIYMLIFITTLFAVFYFINRLTAKNIWSSFNDTLDKLKSFNLIKETRPSFSHTGIKEFEELNQSLNTMTKRIYSDYSRLKQFTENASHEIQTPLSIIRGKIETLIQSDTISEDQMHSLQQINEAVSRLSRLNFVLLTLTKIENYQFTGSEHIDLTSLLENKLSSLEELIQQRKITVTMQFDNKACLDMNASLADLLFDNLLSNAIKHNNEGGFITIAIQQKQFKICNSGSALQISPEKLFERFVKNNPASDSLGLGLALVKKICMSYNMDIEFISNKNIHTITISF